MKQQEIEIHVFQKHGQLFTTSIDVAEKFGKRHSHVLDAIRKICDDSSKIDEPESRLVNGRKTSPVNVLKSEGVKNDNARWAATNFRETSYLDDKNERRPMFEMTRSGFSVLAMGFTGKVALGWKIKYEAAFSLLEQAAINQKNLSWQAQRQQGKIGRREETDTIKEFVTYAKSQGSSKAEFYYKHLTTATYKALFIVKDRFPGSFRDMLDNMQLSYLTAAEFVAANAIKDGMARGLYYKDIYTHAKGKLENYASAVGVTPVISAQLQIAA